MQKERPYTMTRNYTYACKHVLLTVTFLTSVDGQRMDITTIIIIIEDPEDDPGGGGGVSSEKAYY